MLRYAIVRSIQNLPWLSNAISCLLKCLDHFLQKLAVPPDGETLYVLENEGGCVQFFYEANEIKYKMVARIVQGAMPNKRESLTGRAAEDNIYGAFLEARNSSDLLPS